MSRHRYIHVRAGLACCAGTKMSPVQALPSVFIKHIAIDKSIHTCIYMSVHMSIHMFIHRYQDEHNATTCKPCPPNSYRPVGSKAVSCLHTSLYACLYTGQLAQLPRHSLTVSASRTSLLTGSAPTELGTARHALTTRYATK